MVRSAFFVLTALVVLCGAAPALAATISVQQDGTGDFTTIAPAIAASSAGDRIEVGPGTYPEPTLVVSHSLEIVSTDGAASTTLDGQNSIRIVEFEGVGNNSVIEGIRFVDGNASPGIGALAIWQGSDVDARDCIFEANQGGAVIVASGATGLIEGCLFQFNDSQGTAPGGIYVSGMNSQALVQDCDFVGNETNLAGGAISVVVDAYASIEGCRFQGNSSALYASAVNIGEGASADITGSEFVGNEARVTGPIYYYASSGTIGENTFYRNSSLYEPFGTVLIDSTNLVTAYRNIFFGETNGAGIYYDSSVGTHDCNIFWDNDYGSIVGDTLAPTDRVVDPLFCDADAGDYTVSAAGPASPLNSPCGLLIGAREVACTPTASPPAGRAYWLGQNVPNPFNPSTAIPYRVGAGGGHVALRVFDLAGRLVTTLVDGFQTAGEKSMRWTGTDQDGRAVASGTYFCRLDGPGITEHRRMVLLK